MSISQGRFGKYELRVRLGQGGMGDVWKAFDPQLQRYVAIKFLHANLQADPDFMTRFVREAQTIASLHHPNIIQVHDFQAPNTSEEENVPAYMVMNYVEGQTLSEYIHNTSRKGNFPSPTEIAHLFTAISTALDYAHQRGIIHRDIKPANILLDKRNASRNPMGEPILTDFGIVKLMGAANNTLSTGFIGTPNYVSPEQAQGHPGDRRSDIYSLGVILYEIWTGVRPFHGDSPFGIAMQHINTIPTHPTLINPKIPLPVADVILAGLAKKPEDRYSSATEMTNALIQAINKSIQTSPNTNIDRSNSAYLSPIRPITPPALSPSSEYEQGVPLQGHLTPINDVRRDAPVILQAGTSISDMPHRTEEGVGPQSVNPPVKNPVSNPPGMPGYQQLASYGPPLKEATPTGQEQVVVPTRPRGDSIQPPKPALGGGRRPRFRLLIAILILLLLGSSLGTYLLFFHNTAGTTTTPGQPVVGNAFFSSSGQVELDDTRGIADKFQINLFSVPMPATGKNYYAWLLSDLSQTHLSFVALGQLVISDNGNATLIYLGDAQHTNLLATMSRLLITEESGTPTSPSSDKRTWRYYAEIPQKPDPADAGSALDRIRALLCYNPKLLAHNINVVLDPQFVKNTQALLQLATSAASTRDPASIRSEIVNILDYLDGQAGLHYDLPAGVALPADQLAAQLGLISVGQLPTNENYIFLMQLELNFLQTAPGVTRASAIFHFASEAYSELNGSASSSVISLFQKIHTDATNLVSLSDSQLLESSSTALLNDIKNAANSAYNEALIVDKDIEQLAIFDIRPYAA